MTWEVLFSEQVQSWLGTLNDSTYESVIDCIGLLAEQGPQLGRPRVGKIVASEVSNLKELRPSSNSNSHIRILFAFDPNRNAILLLAGDKRGHWEKWYKTYIPVAEQLFQAHLENL